MADVVDITCPECGDKFKSSADKEGKKIRCPECDEPFRVTAKMITLPKGAKLETGIKKAKAAPAREQAPPQRTPPPPPVATAPPPGGDDDDEVGDNPYAVVDVEVKARCPSCAKELLGAKDIICVHCGYNLLTREAGKTEKTVEATGQDQLAHLAPALGALAFAVFTVFYLLFLCLVVPRWFRSELWFDRMMDSEMMRLWNIVFWLFVIFSAGHYALNKLIFDPKPKEREKG